MSARAWRHRRINAFHSGPDYWCRALKRAKARHPTPVPPASDTPRSHR